MGDHIKTIAIDFDGVISAYKGWQGKGVFEKPVEGTYEAMWKLKEDGWDIIINTTRKEIDLIEKYLFQYDIPFDYINFSPETLEQDLSPAKVIADVYVDDRAITFKGDWEDTLIDIKDFKVWWRK